jgi:hypothetical protein
MNKQDFLKYLYNNNHNNVFEHALNICNTWGLGYAISSVGENIPIVPPKPEYKNIYDLIINGDKYEDISINCTGEETLMQNIDLGIPVTANQTFIKEGGWMLMPYQKYGVMKFKIELSKVTTEQTFIRSLTESWQPNLMLPIEAYTIDHQGTTLNAPKQQIPLPNNELYNFPIGFLNGDYIEGITLPAFNYYAEMGPTSDQSTYLNPTPLFNNEEHTYFDIYSEPSDGVYVPTYYLYVFDSNTNKIYTAFNLDGRLYKGLTKTAKQSINFKELAVCLSLSSPESGYIDADIYYSLTFNDSWTPDEIEWFKSITI